MAANFDGQLDWIKNKKELIRYTSGYVRDGVDWLNWGDRLTLNVGYAVP